VLIYLRHGDDHSDDFEYKHDRPLSDVGKRAAVKVAKRLIEKYGHPSIAYVSPFRRATETLDAMAGCFRRAVTVIRDPRIAQFFAKSQRPPKIGKVLANVIDVDENKRDFRVRIDKHLDDVMLANHHRSDVVVWCITHTVVLEYVANYFEDPLSDTPRFLEFIVVT